MITMETLEGIADAVQEAIELIPGSRCRGEEVCMGADGTPTSQIDKVAENAALMYIQRNGIEVNILSEEIGYVDNGAEETLVMDPIDGTSNAIAGIPYYTISLAVGRSRLSDVERIIPGIGGPTVLDIAGNSDFMAVHAVIDSDQTFHVIAELKKIGAKGILTTPIERLVN